MGPSESTIGHESRTTPLWWTRRRLVFAALPVLLLALMYVVATIDIRSHDGQVLRGVTLGTADVGGMDAAELDRELDQIEEIVQKTNVYIETPDAAYQIDAERLGLQLDRNSTTAAVFAAGREGNSLIRPIGWFRSLLSGQDVDAVLALEVGAAEDGLRAVSRTISVKPGQPTLVLRNGRLVLEPGEPGNILDVAQLIRDLGAAIPDEPGQEIFVDGVTTADSTIDVAVVKLVDRLNAFSDEPIELLVNGQSLVVSSEEFRSWVELDLAGDAPVARLDSEVMYRWINAAAGIAVGEVDTRALIVEGNQVRLPPANAVMCCDGAVADQVLEAVLAGTTSVGLELISDDLTPLADLGISELVGEFTTEHPAGQDRAINIRRMADIVRGAVIEPGETFSLNGYVGERTEGKGFVPAGVIYNGVFTEDVGGGVSQFATTLFNASFFGGLDLPRYQPHSIYIDRYPYGREATVSWPSIDLQVRNPTDYPIMIWSEYTPTSITVKLFGTATVSGEQTGQTEEPLSECTKVRTERTRVWADGREEVDYVGATYQPSEGVGCDGLPTVPPPECDEGEVLVDADEDGFGDLCAPSDVICPSDSVPTDEDDDGLIDYCRAESCPDGTEAIDTDGDGQLDECRDRETPLDDAPDAGNPDTDIPDADASDDGAPDADSPEADGADPADPDSAPDAGGDTAQDESADAGADAQPDADTDSDSGTAADDDSAGA